ncbi:hypothetical protein I203_106306 [Kwoniella mangroviensis CBS 8507]|uniref:uncharacterized protein n=1 Tax=Kwoniella mangroviensis CBS 8507 TaxID=1296122 RepID=UPI00306215BA
MTGPTAIEYQGRRHACSSCNQLKRKCQVDPGSYICGLCSRTRRTDCDVSNNFQTDEAPQEIAKYTRLYQRVNTIVSSADYLTAGGQARPRSRSTSRSRSQGSCDSCKKKKKQCMIPSGADSCLTCDARDPRLPCTFRNSRTKRADRRAQHGWLNREPTTLDDYGLRAYIDAPDGVQTLNAIFQEKLGLEYTVSTSQSQNLAPIHHDSGFVWELDNVDDPQHELGAAELVREGAMQGLDFSFGATPSINVSHWPSSDATYDSNE